jgi:hypothetical protein
VPIQIGATHGESVPGASSDVLEASTRTDVTQMASNSRQKTTMAKLTRERAVRERRELKQTRKEARKRAAAAARAAGIDTTVADAQPREAGADGL